MATNPLEVDLNKGGVVDAQDIFELIDLPASRMIQLCCPIAPCPHRRPSIVFP
jgi:hypothetical protein